MNRSEDTIIAVDDLSRTYRTGRDECSALRNISFSVTRGSWTSITGPSGSGKTTLLNIIGALDAHYKGSVKVCGEELRTLNDLQLSRFRGGRLGFIFQQFCLLPHLTILENISLPGFFNPSTGRVEANRANELLERVDLSDKGHVYPSQLSGGQQQRVAIARALYNRAEILLCDEPTGALDTHNSEEVMALFQELNREENLTILVVTHLAHIARMGNHGLQLESGTLITRDTHPVKSVVNPQTFEQDDGGKR